MGGNRVITLKPSLHGELHEMQVCARLIAGARPCACGASQGAALADWPGLGWGDGVVVCVCGGGWGWWRGSTALIARAAQGPAVRCARMSGHAAGLCEARRVASTRQAYGAPTLTHHALMRGTGH